MESMGELFGWIQLFLEMLGVWEIMGWAMSIAIILTTASLLMRVLGRS